MSHTLILLIGLFAISPTIAAGSSSYTTQGLNYFSTANKEPLFVGTGAQSGLKFDLRFHNGIKYIDIKKTNNGVEVGHSIQSIPLAKRDGFDDSKGQILKFEDQDGKFIYLSLFGGWKDIQCAPPIRALLKIDYDGHLIRAYSNELATETLTAYSKIKRFAEGFVVLSYLQYDGTYQFFDEDFNVRKIDKGTQNACGFWSVDRSDEGVQFKSIGKNEGVISWLSNGFGGHAEICGFKFDKDKNVIRQQLLVRVDDSHTFFKDLFVFDSSATHTKLLMRLSQIRGDHQYLSLLAGNNGQPTALPTNTTRHPCMVQDGSLVFGLNPDGLLVKYDMNLKTLETTYVDPPQPYQSPSANWTLNCRIDHGVITVALANEVYGSPSTLWVVNTRH